ncbi:glycosyltransferase family 4 protein [Methanolobus bombayensis]|uniref:glycosyltransferase family 4 protein n=1 Tax=Methanolobus bombayensis TaxID=38023 RepID=UPI001AE98959|nr:glycosyltransferase family 4 protein [Methanolobus bombayensis]MBP1910658.1 glycosyltransferase involved in cell wall biosynthesis [Methanolobus bombayensis]
MVDKNICIVTFPVGKSGLIPLSQLVDIFYNLSAELYLVSGNESIDVFETDSRVHFNGIFHHMGNTSLHRLYNYILAQIKITCILIKMRKKIDYYIFFIGGESLILPILSLKLVNKNVALAMAGYTTKYSSGIYSRVLYLLSNVIFKIVDKLILYSPNLIHQWNLEKYDGKVSIASNHFLNFEQFKIINKYTERSNLIGYVGRLSDEKGVMNLLKAIPLFLDGNKDTEFVLVGDGPMHYEIERFIVQNNITENVRVTGWIPHSELQHLLNSFKLLVIPSYTEGLPNIMLESMSCGTPVLSTSVGSIPDFIEDEKTGFIMDQNSPESIAYNIKRVLRYQDLDVIINNAKNLVNCNFSYEAAVKKYEQMLKK